MKPSTNPRARRHPRLGVAVIGAGYWGPNLVRNFAASAECDLRWVCDFDRQRARKAVGRYSTVRTTDSLQRVLEDPRVEAVAVATPTASHAAVVGACLDAGRHVLVEKPLASSFAEGQALVAKAKRAGRVLMLDHTYCYTPVVRALRDMVRDGILGDIRYIDSVRINLGLVQPDIDVLWDLAPHDLSILDAILPEGCAPSGVAAQSADPLGTGRASIGFLTMPLRGGGIAHVHVNWLSPTKIRTMVVGGSRRTAVWNDLDPAQRLSVYDRGVDLNGECSADLSEARQAAMVSYRLGDMIAPALPEGEALQGVVRELVAAVRGDRIPLSDGESGLRVLRVLEAARCSLAVGGAVVQLDAAVPLSTTARQLSVVPQSGAPADDEEVA
jgi:predicted dehydrogenase